MSYNTQKNFLTLVDRRLNMKIKENNNPISIIALFTGIMVNMF